MSFFFLLGDGALKKPATVQRIAKKHGAEYVVFDDPGTHRTRHLFACKNLGSPHDQWTADAVYRDLVEAGIIEG